MEEVRVKPTVRPLTHIAKEVGDPRFDRGKRYPLSACLLLVWAGLLCGQENLNLIATWGKKLSADFLKILGFKRGIAPSKSTLYDLMPRLDPYELEVRLGDWAESVRVELNLECELPDEKKPLAGVAIDGKTLRGSKKQGALFSHLLSAVVHKIGITLFQVPVSHKTNEIPIMEHLLQELFLEGRVVTMDALLAQRDIAEQIIDSGADYLMNVKLNQPTLHNQIKDLFNPSHEPENSTQQANYEQTNADQNEQQANHEQANSYQSEQQQLAADKIQQLLASLGQFDEPLATKQTDAQEADQLIGADYAMPTSDAMQTACTVQADQLIGADYAIPASDAMQTACTVQVDQLIGADYAMPASDAMQTACTVQSDQPMEASLLIQADGAIEADPSQEADHVQVIEQANEGQEACQSSRVKDVSEQQKENQFARAQTIDRGHGRVDIRILRASDSINSQLDWPHAGQVLTTRRIRVNKATGEILSDQSHYYITSLSPEEASASDLLDLCRDHWTIENKSHYVRDVTFSEDASQVRKGPLPQVMAAFRNTVICALRRLGVTSIKGSLSENSGDPFTVFTYLAM